MLRVPLTIQLQDPLPLGQTRGASSIPYHWKPAPLLGQHQPGESSQVGSLHLTHQTFICASLPTCHLPTNGYQNAKPGTFLRLSSSPSTPPALQHHRLLREICGWNLELYTISTTNLPTSRPLSPDIQGADAPSHTRYDDEKNRRATELTQLMAGIMLQRRGLLGHFWGVHISAMNPHPSDRLLTRPTPWSCRWASISNPPLQRCHESSTAFNVTPARRPTLYGSGGCLLLPVLPLPVLPPP